MLNRDRVDHILRAAGAITGKSKFVLIGSAAIAAWRADIPEIMAMSRDVDLFAYDTPDAEAVADQLSGAIGQASPFDVEFGYYCDGVDELTAILPGDWKERARIYSSPSTNGVEALVPEPNDIALSKAVAWRSKDIDWLRAAIGHRIIDVDTMCTRIAELPSRAGDLGALEARLRSLV